MPYAFTEQGVSMLSSVLNSDTAIEVNIRIIRIFAKLREMLLTHKDILLKLEQMEKRMVQNNDDIQNIFVALRELLNPPQEPRPAIGFKLSSTKKKKNHHTKSQAVRHLLRSVKFGGDSARKK